MAGRRTGQTSSVFDSPSGGRADRLELQIRSLEMNGRIVPLALDAYDTGGLPLLDSAVKDALERVEE